MNNELWWKKPMRVIQYNLQVADTPKMQPKKIAKELKEDYANAVVINVGGIYAWYQSQVPHHHVNEYLPKEGDLLQELLDACHEEDIRVIARFDFSKTDDIVYLQRPEWFVKNQDQTPLIYGKERMGNWSLLLTTCINGGYRNEELAVPVIKEVLNRYDIDGIFFNAPHADRCYCERCQNKYKAYYGEEMPDKPDEIREDWGSYCLRDNIDLINKAAKSVRPDVPLILYYFGYDLLHGTKTAVDNLDLRYVTADLICTEAQNVLSQGVKEVPAIWKPYINMKIGNAVPGYPKPFGIIHSCPGMDWRHAGLPKSEYMFWMAQVMAGNAWLWHSITGFNDTVTDKRLLSAVREIDMMNAACEDKMLQAVSAAQVLLLWDGSKTAAGWVDGMCNMQIQFDLMDVHHMDPERMRAYPVVVVPDEWKADPALIGMLDTYVLEGGHLLLERSTSEHIEAFYPLLGVCRDVTQSQELVSSYLRFETEDETMRHGFEQAVFVPLRNHVLYMKPEEGASCLMTLVPPFAPLDAVGAPPERASMPVDHTDIPMLFVRGKGKGVILTLACSLSRLVLDYHLEDHYWLMRNCLDYLCPERQFSMKDNIAGLLTNVYTNGQEILIHLINGIGQRPLVGAIPCYHPEFTVRLPEGQMAEAVTVEIEEEPVTWSQEGDILTVSVEKLSVWNMICVKLSESAGI